MTAVTARHVNGDIKTVYVTVYFFTPGWGVTRSVRGEAYEFECLGMIYVGAKGSKFTLHGACTEKRWPYVGARGGHAATPVVEPLRQALQAALGMEVAAFHTGVIADGSPEVVQEAKDGN